MLSTPPDHIETTPRPDVEILDGDPPTPSTSPSPTTSRWSRTGFLVVLTAALVAGIAALAWYVTSPVAVELSIDGVVKPLDTRADTVADLLVEQGVEASGDDLVIPSPGTELADGTEVVVRYARPLTVTIDGVETVHTTTELTIGDALDVIGAPVDDAAVSMPLDGELPRDGAAVRSSRRNR